MALGLAATALLGALAFWWGARIGRMLLRRGATATDLFKGRNSASLLALGLYVGLTALALYLPQIQSLPVEWRFYGMQISWTLMRITLLGLCGILAVISWQTARIQVIAVACIGLLGMGGFTAAERYFLAPIYPYLRDNLRASGVYQQTSPSSCAPAALATVLHQWGLPTTESDVARFAQTSRLGTSMPQLIVAARKLQMDGVELSPTWEQMQQINRPGVLATWLLGRRGRRSHAVALLGMTDSFAIIGDPAFGRIYQVPRRQFNRIWRQQYVPIFRSADILLTPDRAVDYLHRWGYGQASLQTLAPTLRQFQAASDLEPTGDLSAETVLLLTGPFLQDAPTLEEWD